MKRPSVRKTSAWLGLFCLSLLIGAGLLERILFLVPCPLCVLQRFILLMLVLGFFFGSLFSSSPTTRRWYYGLLLVITLVGLMTACWQSWLQHLPQQAFSTCAGSLHYLLRNLPLSQAITVIFQSDASCADVKWRFLNFSLANWSAIAFCFIVAGNVMQILRKDRH
jgi:protein dithiol:quinone oxidoreductase